jgi:hypothetical protein
MPPDLQREHVTDQSSGQQEGLLSELEGVEWDAGRGIWPTSGTSTSSPSARVAGQAGSTMVRGCPSSRDRSPSS